jgi:hypothetical protein
MTQKITLQKDEIEIVLEYADDKVILNFTFPDTGSLSLDDYNYLLDKVYDYINSGEYKVTRENI